MKEYVLVEFIAGQPHEANLLRQRLLNLGDDFVLIKTSDESETDEDGNYAEWERVQGKISSMYASVIKLQDPFLAERMRISYIPDDLKDKYRR